MSIEKKLLKPRDILIEKVAGELAATFYEIGRSQGLTSRYKSARAYARANLEKFIPKAVDHLIDCLHSPNLPLEAKEEIHNCLQDRVNDPENFTSDDLLKNIDIKKIIDATATPADKIETRIAQSLDRKQHKDLPPVRTETAPFKATRH